MGVVVLIGRVLFSLVFIFSSFNTFSPLAVGYARSAGVPYAGILVPLGGVLIFVGGVSILLGYHARIGAWLIVVFLVPVTVTMHRFWGVADPAVAMAQQVNFMKNVSMLGAALVIAYFGSGPLSIDGRRRHLHD